MNSCFFQKRLGDLALVEDPSEFHHLIRVMRTRIGEKVRLIDGEGGEYLGELVAIDKLKKTAQVRILSPILTHRELPIKITLAFSPLVDERANEFLIQKCTELGVNVFQPVLFERTQKLKTRAERWLKIAREAVKQSGRSIVPQIRELVSFEEFLKMSCSGTRIFGLIDGPPIYTVKDLKGEVVLLVGPEGDLTEREISLLEESGFKGVGLTPTILRAETAAVVLTAAVSLLGGHG